MQQKADMYMNIIYIYIYIYIYIHYSEKLTCSHLDRSTASLSVQ
jgi:hypothetical protein